MQRGIYMIKTENLKMIYPNGFTAVDGISLDVEKGDIYGFLGPNGAGKTTTIRILTGLIRPTGGKVSVADTDVLKNPEEVKSLAGVLPESQGFYNWMNGAEYLNYFADLYSVEKSDKQTLIDGLLQKVGLADNKKTKIGHYSRGMKQRLGIAKALINSPTVIFLDEPTLGLDPLGQKDIYEMIMDINRQTNITVFITSHLLKDIEVLCNKICVVINGKMAEQGEINLLKQKYQNLLGKDEVTVEDIFFTLTDGKDGEQDDIRHI